MSNAVIKVTKAQLNKMQEYYSNVLEAKVPPGGMFRAKKGGCSITAYNSGKVLFQGGGAEAEAARWGNTADGATTTKSSKPKKVVTHRFSPPENIASLSIVGSDEVGTGDFFGPMTVVACYVPTEQMDELKRLGVQDSKNLTDARMIEIADNIKEKLTYSLLVLRNEKYNSLQRRGMNQGEMKAKLHNRALRNVLQKIENKHCDGILIDQFVKPESYFAYLKGEKDIVREHVYFSTKGEQVHLAVAAASILARVAFVREFEKLSLEVGMTLPKGAGPKVDQVAAELIRLKGKDMLEKTAKLHFANYDKAMDIVNKG